MHKLYAENILIGSSWQTDMTLSIASNGKILAIDGGRDPKAVRLKGTVVPGMVNCHSHTFQRAFAGYSEYRGNDYDSFWSWRDIMYRFVSNMTPEDAYIVAKFAYIEMLKAGYTSVAEFHYLHHQTSGNRYENPAEMSEQIIEAASSVGMAITHLPVLYSYAGFGKSPTSDSQARFVHTSDEYLRLYEKLHRQYAGISNFALGIAPHSLRAVSEEQLREIVLHVRGLDKSAPIHIHIAEQLQEVKDCHSHYGKRPVEWLLSNFKMDSKWCLVHATHITSSESNRLAKSGAVAGICPITEANLGDGIFPTAEYLMQGGRLAIGTDSHVLISVAEELRMLEYGQRLTKQQRAVLVDEHCSSVGQYLYAKTCYDGASAINQNVGEIAIGKRADLIVLDEQHPSLYSKKGSMILDASLFACSQMPVRDVYVAGKQTIGNGRHEVEDQIKEQYQRLLARLVS